MIRASYRKGGISVHRSLTYREAQLHLPARALTRNICLFSATMACAVSMLCSQAAAQTPTELQIQSQTPPPAQQPQLLQPTGPNGEAAPATITLKDAIDRARKVDAQYLAARQGASLAQQDRLQARNAMLPQLSYEQAYLNTQGNGRYPEGRFVTNDGVHVYNLWAVYRQDLSPNTYLATGYKRSEAAEALAKANAEIAQRGLTVTVTKNYYALVVAQRKYATAQDSLQQSKNFLDITQSEEKLGVAAHSDTVKALVQYDQQLAAFEDAKLAIDTARLALAVMLSPTLDVNFTVVDDLDAASPLPEFPEVQTMASKENPDLRVALQGQREADLDVVAAKSAFLPSMSIETDYGIQANAIALHSAPAAHHDGGPVPDLGYFLTASLNLPVWDWGTLRSKLHQAKSRQEQARVELNQTQRELLSDLYSFYNEASVARSAVDTLRQAADAAAESLRLVNLRYQGGASTALEVVDAENTLTQARNGYNDAQVRYRTALAELQTLTGSF